MQLIQTPSFKLACYCDGDMNSDTLFLCIPGFLDAGNYNHLRSHRSYFAEKGFFCVSFDPPGTFLSPGDISLYTVTNYLKAIDEVIEYFGNKKTIILGHSIGGSIAILASRKNSIIMKSISIMSPYSFQEQFAKPKYTKRKQELFRTGVRDIPNSHKQWNYSISYDFVEDALQYNLVESVRNLKQPKLFLAGLQDDIITPNEVYQGYLNANDPKTYLEIDCDHNYRFDVEKIVEVNRMVERFLEM